MADEQTSIDDTIAETYQAILARESADDTPAEPLDTVEAPADEVKDDRARDEHGRFAKTDKQEPAEVKVDKQKDAKTPAAQEPAAPNGATPPPKEDATPAAAEPVLRADGRPADLARPPAEWKPGAKAKWASLDPEVRAEIHRREVDAFKKFSEFAPEAEVGRTLRSLSERYQQVVALDGGGDPVRAVGSLFNTAHVLRFGTAEQKMAARDQIEKVYGIPPRQPSVDANGQPVQQPPQQAEFRDPRVDSLMANWQQQEQQRRAEQDRIASDATTRFLSATNDRGEPLYPFVDNVLEDMTARVQQLRARNPSLAHEEALKQAYEAASWANPEVRTILQQQEVARLEAQRREANLQKVESARKAAAGNVSRRGSPPAQAPVGTIEDTILQTYREITSRG